MTMKRGLSLSLCVRDIIDGRVNVEDVEVIVTNTAARDSNDWSKLMDQYCNSYWRGQSDRARRVVDLLLAADRIVQPRLNDRDYRHDISNGVWV